MSEERVTVGDLREAIKNLPDELPLIYSHDNEGNEYQFVIFKPHVTYIKKSGWYRDLKPIGNNSKKIKDGIKCLSIN